MHTFAAPPRRGADVREEGEAAPGQVAPHVPTRARAGARPVGAMAPWGLVAAAWLVLGAVTAHGASPGGALEP